VIGCRVTLGNGGQGLRSRSGGEMKHRYAIGIQPEGRRPERRTGAEGQTDHVAIEIAQDEQLRLRRADIEVMEAMDGHSRTLLHEHTQRIAPATTRLRRGALFPARVYCDFRVGRREINPLLATARALLVS